MDIWAEQAAQLAAYEERRPVTPPDYYDSEEVPADDD